MKKKCLSCSRSFTLSGSGKRQNYCPECSRHGAPRRVHRARGLSASKSLKTKPTETQISEEIGSCVRRRLEAQKAQPNPINFSLPDGTKGRVWLASSKDGSKIIGADRLWRVN